MRCYKDELQRITGILLKPEDDYGELSKAISDLQQLFQTVSGLKTDDSSSREDIYLANGKAIGPVWAAMCVNDHLRTKRFISGFYQGIRATLKKFPCRPVHILYAGTGPFATLAVPLTTVFTSDEIRFTFLEINSGSIQLLEKVIEAFQIEPFVFEIVKCDAAKYQRGRNRPIHMIITETMQNALQKEPQVAITLNLLPQMEEAGTLIPQNIVVEAVLLSPKKDMDRITGLNIPGQDCYYPLSKIFALNKHTSPEYLTAGFPAVEFEIPNGIPAEYKHFCLFTTIQIFETVRLEPWQSSLTQPKRISILDQDKNRAQKLSFRYILNEKPGFEFIME